VYRDSGIVLFLHDDMQRTGADMSFTSPSQTVIGRYYEVPCLVLPFINQIAGYGPDVPHIPVQLPSHHDKELGVEFEHFHIDWRFVGKASYEANLKGSRYPLMGCIVGNIDRGKLEYRRMQCKREMPSFPATANDVFARFEAKYQKLCINPDKPVCPHRGVDLRTAPIEIIDGKAVLICPGHGLGWDAETGVNVARHGTETQV
jgi:hypothetical protein